MSIVWALVTALAYGTGDFLGGLVSRRTAPLAVALLSQAAGGAALLGAVLLFQETAGPGTFAWGAAAGVASSVAYVLYLRGLARGPMGVVSTLAAVWAAVVPFAAGLLQGERPGAAALLGAVTVLLGVVLVSAGRGSAAAVRAGVGGRPGRNRGRLAGFQGRAGVLRGTHGRPGAPHDRLGVLHGSPGVPHDRLDVLRGRPGVPEGSLAGVAYGIGFVCLKEAGSSGALWPVLVATAATVLLLGGVAWAVRSAIGPALRYWPLVAGMGLLHALAAVAFVLAARAGMLSIVSVVAAMGPAPTALLAWRVLREKLQPAQGWGLVLGLAGIALLTAA